MIVGGAHDFGEALEAAGIDGPNPGARHDGVAEQRLPAVVDLVACGHPPVGVLHFLGGAHVPVFERHIEDPLQVDHIVHVVVVVDILRPDFNGDLEDLQAMLGE